MFVNYRQHSRGAIEIGRPSQEGLLGYEGVAEVEDYSEYQMPGIWLFGSRPTPIFSTT